MIVIFEKTVGFTIMSLLSECVSVVILTIRVSQLTPVILATWEAEIRRMEVQGQPRQTVYRTPSPK
jgi:hypothetical protein